MIIYALIESLSFKEPFPLDPLFQYYCLTGSFQNYMNYYKIVRPTSISSQKSSHIKWNISLLPFTKE